ncbi:MAG: hypothetical protein ABIJ48_00425 [Actinomycetota bacterium]
MSPESSRRRAGPERRPEVGSPISSEEVAAVLAAVKALVEEEAAATEAPGPAKPDAWAAAGRTGHPTPPRRRRPGRPGT